LNDSTLAVRRYRIAGERAAEALGHVSCSAQPHGLVVLDDGGSRLVEFANQLPGGVQIDVVVVRKFLAVQLLGVAMPGSPVTIDRGLLVRILAVSRLALRGARISSTSGRSSTGFGAPSASMVARRALIAQS
jgi:hypothetical protein